MSDKQKNEIQSYQNYYCAVKKHVKKINHALNVFQDAKENDLLWTKDLDGYDWICSATGAAQTYYNKSMDIGTVLPIEACNFELDIPGQIKASFNRPCASTAESIEFYANASIYLLIAFLTAIAPFYPILSAKIKSTNQEG